MTGIRSVAAIVALNALLATLVHAAAPAQPANSDRQEYEYVGQHGFEANCTWSVYCYRVLVPMLLEEVPIDAELRWRGLQLFSTTVAGTILSLTTASVANGFPSAVLAAIVVQASYGFAFTAYDPYTADPLVFVIAALFTWLWLANRWLAALALGVIGVFAKETVALISGATALAALINRERPGWRHWVVQGAVVAGVLLGFHWVMDTYFGWAISNNPAAQFSEGSWLARWWHNNPGLWRKGFFLFAPFGFAWLFALAGFRFAPRDLRALAIGVVLPFLALNYVQNPERALGNTFFVVVPLAVIALARVPFSVALIAVITNAAVTAKVGSSTAWLPSSTYLLLAAGPAAAWMFWHLSQRPQGPSFQSPAKGPTLER